MLILIQERTCSSVGFPADYPNFGHQSRYRVQERGLDEGQAIQETRIT